MFTTHLDPFCTVDDDEFSARAAALARPVASAAFAVIPRLLVPLRRDYRLLTRTWFSQVAQTVYQASNTSLLKRIWPLI